jgi:asparagine synthase (glutamine-hydrolysing)
LCGIAGIVLEGGTVARADLLRMISTLRHRGPDGSGVLEAGRCGLAHVRLSIIDLATGAQPIANESRTVWTVFSGEIFNYLELRAELQSRGHRFSTQSDTETIVHAYEEYGDSFVERLNGQFAIAIWDVPRQRLVLARDRTGIRPLFYARLDGRLLFASEIKAIRAVAGSRLELDPKSLAQLFTLWSNVGSRTVFKGIRTLPPGHVLVLEGGTERSWRYWDWTFPPGRGRGDLTLAQAAEELRTLLLDAIRLQLRSEVPVGAYLSGGVDSAGIVALVRHHTDAPLRTFSVSFDDPEYDESGHQAAVARHFGTEHTDLRCAEKDIGEVFPDLIWHTETPVLRTAPAPLMLLSRLVREAGYKVVLTGEGADEVFGGYDLFREAKIRRFWSARPESRWRPRLLERLYPYLGSSPVANASTARWFFGRDIERRDDPFYAHTTRWATTRGIWKFFSAELRAALVDWQPEEELAEQLPKGFSAWSELARDQYVEVRTLLEGYLLSSQGDRVAMAHSVESRVPYLDHRVVEFVNQLSPRYKLRGLREKVVLRHALAGLLPVNIAARAKQPYRAPDCRSFFVHGQPLPYVAELLSPTSISRSGYFDAQSVRHLLEKCRSNRAIGAGDNMAFVGIISTQLLHDHFIEKGSSGEYVAARADQGIHSEKLPLQHR